MSDRVGRLATLHGRPPRRVRRTLLAAGIGATGVYAFGDLVSGLLYDGYRFNGQAISELSAYGSPVRAQMVTFLTVHDVLLMVFGAGLWRAGRGNRALQAAAALLLAAAAETLPLHPFFPMSSRGMEAGFNDTMHQDLTIGFALLVVGAVALSGTAYRGWFRRYAAASALAMVVFGSLAARAAPGIARHEPTPWLGAAERVNAYVYLAWIVVLALRASRPAGQ